MSSRSSTAARAGSRSDSTFVPPPVTSEDEDGDLDEDEGPPPHDYAQHKAGNRAAWVPP